MARNLGVIAMLLATWLLPALAQEQPEFTAFFGGGIGTPLNPTSNFAGLSGTFEAGAGYNLDRHQSIVGQFMWQGLPPNRRALLPLSTINVSNNLYSLTANYVYQVSGARFGGYFIGGGGWYYRYAQLKNNVVVPGTVCQPAFTWWGYVCEGGFVAAENTVATRGNSAFGGNGGVGFTIRLSDTDVKFFTEARYHYAGTRGVSTQVIPVSFGVRF